MKLGLISDIHGDPLALELAWSHLMVLGADRIICAGDLVGYGPFPDRAVAFMEKHQIATVRGNHDRWAMERGPGVPDEFHGGPPSSETLAYLTALPFDLLVSEHPRIGVVVHGSPRSDMEFVNRNRHPGAVLRGYLTELHCDLLVVGHHAPTDMLVPLLGGDCGQSRLCRFDAGGRLLANVRPCRSGTALRSHIS